MPHPLAAPVSRGGPFVPLLQMLILILVLVLWPASGCFQIPAVQTTDEGRSPRACEEPALSARLLLLVGQQLALELMAVRALLFLAQAAQDAAVVALAALALVEQCLQMAAQMLQGGNLLVHIADMPFHEGVDPVAVFRGMVLEGQKFLDLGKGHAVQAAVADEAQLLKILCAVDTVIALGALRALQKAFLLVIAYGDNLTTGLFCQLSNLHTILLPHAQ